MINSHLRPNLPPSHLLLRLEWLLLGLTAAASIVTALFYSFPRMPIFAILSIAAFGLMGIETLPRQRWQQILYIALEFGLIWSPILIHKHFHPFPLLGLVVVLRSCRMFTLPGRLVTAGLAFLSFLLALLQNQANRVFLDAAWRSLSFDSLPNTPHLLSLNFNSAFSFGGMLLLVLLLANALLAQQQSQEHLAAALQQIRHYALQIEDQSALQERNRIARDIHDALGHTLTAQSVQLSSALALLSTDREQASCFLQTSKQLCAQALQEVRQSVAMLRSGPLQGKTLEMAIAQLVNELHCTTGISPKVSVSLLEAISNEVQFSVYRVLQEALTNIIRHSAATEVTLQVLKQDNILYLLVRDNGKGFDTAQSAVGFGIQGMQERIAGLGGQLNLVSQPGAGCLITARIPLSPVMTDCLTGVEAQANHGEKNDSAIAR